MTSRDQLFRNQTQQKLNSANKVTIVGSGTVATSTAFSILVQGISNDVVIISRNEDKVKGELLDFQHSSHMMKNVRVSGGVDVSMSSGSKLIIFAAGIRHYGDEINFEEIQENAKILKYFLPKLVRGSPDAVLLIVSDPCDILCFVAWKLSGFPKHRVIGSGLHLQSSRFRFLLSQKFDIAMNSTQGWIIGEQGQSSVPIWSNVSFAGVKLREMNPAAGDEKDLENWSRVYEEAMKSDGTIKNLKGFSSWGIALSCSDIAAAILHSSNEIHVVSTMVKTLYSITKEVFLSLPCVLSSNGVSSVVNLKLTDDERRKLHKSTNLIDEIQKGINF